MYPSISPEAPTEKLYHPQNPFNVFKTTAGPYIKNFNVKALLKSSNKITPVILSEIAMAYCVAQKFTKFNKICHFFP